jgi:hypothetical protein
LHDYFTVTDEPEDVVADENEYVRFEYGYGRPDLGEYEQGEIRDAFEETLDEFWPVERRGSASDDEDVVESERVCEDGNEGVDENEEPNVGGDGGSDQVRTNTDTITAAVAAVTAEEEEVSTNSRYTNPDTFVAPTPANTPTQRYFRLAAEEDVSTINRNPNTDNPFALTPVNTPTQRFA